MSFIKLLEFITLMHFEKLKIKWNEIILKEPIEICMRSNIPPIIIFVKPIFNIINLNPFISNKTYPSSKKVKKKIC